jgi:hypothetical protein
VLPLAGAGSTEGWASPGAPAITPSTVFISREQPMSTFERMLKVLGATAGGEFSRVAESSRPNGSGRQRTARMKSRASKQLAVGVQAERLEQRLAMAINIFPQNGDLQLPASQSNWKVIVSDNADDVYVQQVATARQNLLVADNASFNNSQEVIGIDSYTSLYATNGTTVSVAGVHPAEVGGGTTTSYVLSNSVWLNLDGRVREDFVSGRVSYAGNEWAFTNGGLGNILTFTLVTTGTLSDPNIVRPVSGSVTDAYRGAATATNPERITIYWSAAPVAVSATGIELPIVTSVSYSRRTDIVTSDFNLRPTAGASPLYVLPATAARPGAIVPGTLNGGLTVGATTIRFCTDNLFTPIGGSALDNHLYFENGSRTGAVTIDFNNSTTPTSRRVTFTGYVDYQTGQIFLDFSADPGPVSLNSHYAVYSQDARPSQFTVAAGQTLTRDLYTQLLTSGSSININSPVIQAAGLGGVPGVSAGGLTLNATNINLNAEVRSASRFDVGFNTGVVVNADQVPEVRTAIARPVIGPGGKITAIGIPSGLGGQGYSATNPPRVTIVGSGSGATAEAVVMNGVVTAITMVTSGSGYGGATTVTIDPPEFTIGQSPRNEQVNFNAAVSASSYSLIIGDDPNTLATPRGRMFVSSSGSLTGQGGNAANSLVVLANTSDLAVEGKINAANQSYLMQSPNKAQGLAPFTFTTVSPLTGANVGLIQGTNVAITLGNDLDTPEQSSVAANTVNLQTKISSLRVTAATRAGDPLSGPFPYDLTISEQDAITFDAVAASSRAISLFAVGGLTFNSALATAGDLSIRSSGDFSISAPLSTSRGQIAISANSLTVANSIRVLAPSIEDSRDDITLTANAGDLNLTGAISGVNNIRLVQRNKASTTGKIAGSTRLVSRGVSVESEGAVNVRTDVVSLEGRAAGDFAVDELNDISITSLRAAGLVSLRAAGTDPGAENPFSPNTIALQATLYDVTSLDVSAPRGSVAITTDTSKTLTLGNAAAIASGKATSMQAAGSVTIRSLAGPVVVADAPLGGGSAIAARFAFADDLSGAYNQGTPGLFASTLTGGKYPLVSEEGVVLGVGDRILLRGQANQNENGVYVVTVSGSLGRSWVLTRAPDADASSELLAGGFVQVLEGLYANSVYRIGYAPTGGDSPLAVSMVPNRAGAEVVRVATTSTLAGSYDSVAGTIAAAGNLPLIDGVSLSVGDRVLVRMGTADAPPAGTSGTPLPVSAANGVYEVVSAGGLSGTWSLARATNIDTGSAIESGFVITTEGSYRAAVTGQAFAVSYESLGVDPLTFAPLAAEVTATDIGTEDINDVTTFVVSSTAGSNAAAGSLGKMIAIRQALGTGSELNPAPKVDFAFSTNLPALAGGTAGAIRLTQELPAISKAFAINGASRFQLSGGPASSAMGVAIDGSRITTTRTGQPVAAAAGVNGIEFVTGSQSSIGSAGGSVSNLTIGGFATGAAVKINGVNGILVNKVVLGRNATGDRLANMFGVLATGAQAEGTVSGSTIVGSTQAGIQTEDGAAGLAIVGTTVGVANQGNVTGIRLTTGFSSVGIDPLVTTNSAIRTVRDHRILVLPPTISPRRLHLGQIVSGPGIASGTTFAAINGATVTLSKAMIATGVTKGIRFTSPAKNTVQYNLTGMVLSGGANIVTNSNIGNNVYSGILAQGGIQQIGTARKTSGASNAIYGNGRFGVEVVGASQMIIGNNFGVQGRNQQANVVVNGITPSRHVPNARTRLDANGNFHAVSTVAATKKGSPWRPV